MVHGPDLGQSKSFKYEWILTKDGSLTLKFSTEDSEWMHSLHGAYSESQYIYGDALRMILKDFDRDQTLNIMSMGLGLGYLEWIAIFECFKVNQKFKIYSYELDPQLEMLFTKNSEFLLGVDSLQSLNSVATFETEYGIKLSEVKKGIFDFYVKDYGQELIEKSYQEILNVKFQGPFETSKILSDRNLFHLVFYDAFSSNTQNELWSENFLNQFISHKCDLNICIFSTYAKVGVLNRILKNNGFNLIPKKGFAFKRESTLALRVPGPVSGHTAQSF